MDGMTGRVHVKVPAQPAYLRLGRLVAAGLAGECGFTVDEVDELRIAVDELIHLMAQESVGDEIELEYRVHDDTINVLGSRSGVYLRPEIDPLVAEILDAAADSWEVTAASNSIHFAVTKHRRWGGGATSFPGPGP
jgi:serine/threonine-protein kinase RsbW